MIWLSLHPEAVRDSQKVQENYAEIRPQLAQAFSHELIECLERIQAFPELYAVEFEIFRIMPMRRFPYLMYYSYESDRIRIMAIIHEKRDPSILLNRNDTP